MFQIPLLQHRHNFSYIKSFQVFFYFIVVHDTYISWLSCTSGTKLAEILIGELGSCDFRGLRLPLECS
jgi:hypothetical protein